MTKSLVWRDISLVTLSSLAAVKRDFPAFRNYAVLWFSEFNPDHPLRFSLLYYLARYTDQDPEKLKQLMEPGNLLKKGFSVNDIKELQ